MNQPTIDATVIIPTYGRPEALAKTLNWLAHCRPSPREIIVHVDKGDNDTPTLLQDKYPEVFCIQSDTQQGPGGGRNKLMKAASHDIVVSLDDDSWPMDDGFFRRAQTILGENPDIGVLACQIFEADQAISSDVEAETQPAQLEQGTGFVGCGAILRKTAFATTAGYLPLRYAYGMEEADVSLQLIDNGFQICFCRDLRVFHDCDRDTHHANAKINAAQITNTALLAFLRYPLTLWVYGFLQVLNRVAFCIRKRRIAGTVTGLLNIPGLCWKYKKHRKPVKTKTITFVRSGRCGESQA